jgi:hypothetical protein
MEVMARSMTNLLKSHKWLAGGALVALLAVCWMAAVMIKPPQAQAFTLIEMPAFTFNPVEIGLNQVGEVCAVNWGDATISALIGLLDVADTTKSASPIQSVELKAHSSSCFQLPAVQRPTTAAATIPWTFPFVAVRHSAQWNAKQKDLTVSLQVLDGGSTKFVVPGTFLPAVQLPAP